MSIVDAALQRLKAEKAAAASAASPDKKAPAPPQRQVAEGARAPATPVVEALLPQAPALQMVAGGALETIDGSGNRLEGQLRGIRQVVLSRVREKHAAGRTPVVLVTSAVPGDGKSFMSLNLALSLARVQDLTVTLVDADLAKRQVTRMFAGDGERGVAECLRESGPALSVTRETNHPRLRFVPAGDAGAIGADLLTDSAWESFVSGMRSNGPGHIVVVDSAPVLATGEALHIARSADCIVFVVRAGTTPAPAVQAAASRLASDEKMVVVLNGVQGIGQADYYHYASYPSGSGD